MTLNDTQSQMDLTIIFRSFHLKTAKYTVFSCPHGTFSRVDHILGHKTSLNIYKKIKVISRMLSNDNGMRLEIN